MWLYKGLMVKIGLLLFFITFFLYSYLVKQNELTKKKIELPSLVKSVKEMKEENKRLLYEVDLVESPSRLMELVRSPEFSHLKHPFVKDILTIPEGVALHEQLTDDHSHSAILGGEK